MNHISALDITSADSRFEGTPPSWMSSRDVDEFFSQRSGPQFYSGKYRFVAGNSSGTTDFDPAQRYNGEGIKIDNNPESPWEGVMSINHFAHTPFVPLSNGRKLIMETVGGVVELLYDVAQWRIEFTDKVSASTIWKNRDKVSAVVLRHGGNSRLKISIDGSVMTIEDYDYGRWSETVNI